MITNVWPSQRRHRGDQKSRCPSQKLIWPEAWHLSFSHGRRLTPLPRLRPSNIYASAFSLCWEEPAAADRGWHSASDCPLTQKQSEACVNTNALPSPPPTQNKQHIKNTSKSDGVWMHTWTFTIPRAWRQSAVLQCRAGCFQWFIHPQVYNKVILTPPRGDVWLWQPNNCGI